MFPCFWWADWQVRAPFTQTITRDEGQVGRGSRSRPPQDRMMGAEIMRKQFLVGRWPLRASNRIGRSTHMENGPQLNFQGIWPGGRSGRTEKEGGREKERNVLFLLRFLDIRGDLDSPPSAVHSWNCTTYLLPDCRAGLCKSYLKILRGCV